MTQTGRKQGLWRRNPSTSAGRRKGAAQRVAGDCLSRRWRGECLSLSCRLQLRRFSRGYRWPMLLFVELRNNHLLSCRYCRWVRFQGQNKSQEKRGQSQPLTTWLGLKIWPPSLTQLMSQHWVIHQWIAGLEALPEPGSWSLNPHMGF